MHVQAVEECKAGPRRGGAPNVSRVGRSTRLNLTVQCTFPTPPSRRSPPNARLKCQSERTVSALPPPASCNVSARLLRLCRSVATASLVLPEEPHKGCAAPAAGPQGTTGSTAVRLDLADCSLTHPPKYLLFQSVDSTPRCLPDELNSLRMSH